MLLEYTTHSHQNNCSIVRETKSTESFKQKSSRSTNKNLRDVNDGYEDSYHDGTHEIGYLHTD